MHPNRQMKVTEKSKRGVAGVLKELTDYSASLKLPLLASVLLALVGAVFTLIGPNRMSDITNMIAAGLTGTIDLPAITKSTATLMGFFLLSSLALYLQHFIMAGETLALSHRLRTDLSAKINRVPLQYFNTHSHGDILSRVTNDVSQLQQTLANSLPSMISGILQILAALVMMFVTEWHLAIAAILSSLLGFALMGLLMKISQKYFIARQKNLGELNGYIEEMYSGHSVVNLSLASDDAKIRFDQYNRAVYEAERHSQFLSGLMQPLMAVIGNLSYVVVVVYGATLALEGTISYGLIIAFIMYVRLLSMPLGSIAQGMTNLQSAAAAGDRVLDFLQSEERPDESHKTAHLDPVQIHGDVVFEHVRFSYPDSPEQVIIKDFSATVKAGQKVAIVGPTGAGKTTLVNLLMRFYDIDAGRILIDGTELSALTRPNARSLFSMVLQDSWLFEGSVRENLCYNRTGISDEELYRALEATGLDRFVRNLPQKLDTILSENITISIGQKQLFTIARAIIQGSPMLILDEATSSVDTRTEQVIQRAMDKLCHGRTSFVIAHRLSTIKNADLILVLKEGDIIEQGSHDELLARKGFYADLYNSQFDSVA